MSRTTLSLLLMSLAAGSAAAQVCDLVELTTVAAEGSLSQPAILGTSAYVAAGSAGIARFSLAQADNPVYVESYPTGGQAMDLAVDYFSSRLVVANGSGGVTSYQLDPAGVPVELGALAVEQTVISVASGTSRFLAGSEEGTLYVLSAGSGDMTADGAITLGGPVRGIAVQSSRAYCALGDGGLAVVDFSDPSDPQLVASVDLDGAVQSVVRDGSMLFCGVEGTGLVGVLVDGTTLLPSTSLALPAAPTRVVTWGGRLYMVGPELGIAEADASLGTDVLLLARLELAGANGLVLAGNTVYVGRGALGLAVVDASDCSQQGVLPTTAFIPASARAVGAADTYWVTDVAIANLTASVATCNLAYLEKNQENSNPLNLSLVLQAGQQILVEDLYSTLFELDSANGALRLIASHPDVKATSRTYNAAGTEGTYGQFIPALARSQAIEAGLVGSLLQLQENAGFRTNVGLLNITERPVEVQVHLYLGSGNLVGVRTENLLPFEMVQLDRIFASVGATSVDSGFATVQVTTSGGRALAYASVVDNGSGDPILIPTQVLTTGTPFGP